MTTDLVARVFERRRQIVDVKAGNVGDWRPAVYVEFDVQVAAILPC